jgi:hypothetical protein
VTSHDKLVVLKSYDGELAGLLLQPRDYNVLAVRPVKLVYYLLHDIGMPPSLWERLWMKRNNDAV